MNFFSVNDFDIMFANTLCRPKIANEPPLLNKGVIDLSEADARPVQNSNAAPSCNTNCVFYLGETSTLPIQNSNHSPPGNKKSVHDLC